MPRCGNQEKLVESRGDRGPSPGTVGVGISFAVHLTDTCDRKSDHQPAKKRDPAHTENLLVCDVMIPAGRRQITGLAWQCWKVRRVADLHPSTPWPSECDCSRWGDRRISTLQQVLDSSCGTRQGGWQPGQIRRLTRRVDAKHVGFFSWLRVAASALKPGPGCAAAGTLVISTVG